MVNSSCNAVGDVIPWALLDRLVRLIHAGSVQLFYIYWLLVRQQASNGVSVGHEHDASGSL